VPPYSHQTARSPLWVLHGFGDPLLNRLNLRDNGYCHRATSQPENRPIHTMKQPPISAFDATSGMLYFGRMLDKIHKHARGELREDFLQNLGGALDERCADYLRVPYADIAQRTLEGGSPEDILQWCFVLGRALDENDILIWNHFVSKLGWKDHVSETLKQRKAESNLADRNEIETMLEYFEYDEGRK